MSSRERKVFPSPVRISTSSLGWTSFNNWNEDYIHESHYCNVSDCSCFCQHCGIPIFFNYLWKSKLVRIMERFEKSGVKLQCWLVKGSWFGSNYREFRKTAVSKNGVFTVMHYYKPLDKCLLLKMQYLGLVFEELLPWISCQRSDTTMVNTNGLILIQNNHYDSK